MRRKAESIFIDLFFCISLLLYCLYFKVCVSLLQFSNFFEPLFFLCMFVYLQYDKYKVSVATLKIVDVEYYKSLYFCFIIDVAFTIITLLLNNFIGIKGFKSYIK